MVGKNGRNIIVTIFQNKACYRFWQTEVASVILAGEGKVRICVKITILLRVIFIETITK
jgi:hypothetical protein